MLSILVSMMSGVVFASADEAAATSTLTEILSYDFDSDVSEFETQMGYYATIINGTNKTGSAKTDSNTYGIGAYRQLDTQAYLPLVVDNSDTTPVLSGIDRLQTPNKYIEVEYDYKPVTFVHTDNPAYQNFGVGAVTYDSNSALNHTSYFGSLYHTHGASVSSPYWGYEYSGATHDGSFDNCSHPVTLDKWYRVKLVCQLTTDTLKDGSDSKYKIPTTKCIKTYVDGELVNEKYYKNSVSNLTDEYVRALRFHASYGRAGIDNLTVRTYQSGDAPVDKGALVAAIRNFEEQNPGYTDYPGAVELINSAKATYENASASAADVTAAIADVNNAVDAMVPYTVVKAYDFEDNYDAYLAALRTTWNNSSTLANGQNTDDSVYAIGKYETRVSNFLIPLTDETETINIGTEDTPVTATVPKGIKIEGENLYVQTEFDYKVVESTPGTDKNYSAGGMLLTGFSTETNPAKLFEAQKAFGTIYHQFEPATEDTPSSAEFTAYSYVNGKASTTTGAPYIGAAEVDKWQRIKIVTQVTDSTGAMSSSNKIYFYVDGELVHTRNLHSSVATYSDGYIRFLRQHLSNGRQAIDNISVVTYRGLDNAPADKGTLVAAIRSFEADYPTYASSDSAADLINAAKTVYEDDDATKEQVDEAILKVNSAVQIFNPTDGMAIYCKDGKIVVNGSFVSDTALDEQYMTIIATYDDEGNLIRADMSEPMPVAAGNNPIHFEADIVLPEQQVTAYTWTTDTYTPLCKPVSDTITALKIFAIGNSFSIDSMEYLYNIAKSSGQFDSIVLGNAYIAGCSLDTHWENTSIDEANYTYYKNTAGIWKSEDKSLKDMLTDETWNLISMQTSPFNAGLPDTFGNLSNMTEWINTNKTNPNAELMWNMTWACAADYADNPSFRWFDYDQMKFYDSIVSTTQSVIEPNADIKYIMPVGTTIQNMRTSFIEEADNITRDGYHLGYSVGRYAAALTWFNKLTNISVDSINYNPDSTVITENVLAVIRESVNNAIRTPYAVTKSQYTE